MNNLSAGAKSFCSIVFIPRFQLQLPDHQHINRTGIPLNVVKLLVANLGLQGVSMMHT